MKYSMLGQSDHLQTKIRSDTGGLFNNMDSIRRDNTSRPTMKPKRFRSAFTTEQVNYLEQQFKKFPYISSEHRKEIAAALNMQERAIKIWFQNRRMKEKKETCNKELDADPNNKEEFGKDRLINGSAPSTNDQLSYSLPITKPSITNTVIKANTDIAQQTQHTSMRSETLSASNQFPGIKYHLQTAPYISNNNPVSYKSLKTTGCQKQRKESRNLKQQVPTMSGKSSASKPRTVPEDLSAKRKLRSQLPSKPPKQANVNSPAYISMMPTVYAHPFLSPGGMIWKPINVMPVMSGTAMNVPSHTHENGSGQTKSCNCDCHGNAQSYSIPPNPINPYTQYVLTAPFPKFSSSPKF